jgi:hypothetical protein
MNDPPRALTFQISKRHLITYVRDYHWNNGRGQIAGTIGLRNEEGQLFGPWQAYGSAEQGGAPNVNWEAIRERDAPAGKVYGGGLGPADVVVEPAVGKRHQHCEGPTRGVAALRLPEAHPVKPPRARRGVSLPTERSRAVRGWSLLTSSIDVTSLSRSGRWVRKNIVQRARYALPRSDTCDILRRAGDRLCPPLAERPLRVRRGTSTVEGVPCSSPSLPCRRMVRLR